MLDTRPPSDTDSAAPTVVAFAKVTLDTLRANNISDEDIRSRFLPEHPHADNWFIQLQVNRCGFVLFEPKEVKQEIKRLLDEDQVR